MVRLSMVVVMVPRVLSFFAFLGCYAPESVVAPCTFLALLAAVFGTPTSSAFSKLSGVLFPLAALPVCTLSDSTTAFVFTAEVTHHHTCPVLHRLVLLSRSWQQRLARAGASYSKFLDQRENVKCWLFDEFIVPCLLELFLRWPGEWCRWIIVSIQCPQLGIDLEPWY